MESVDAKKMPGQRETGGGALLVVVDNALDRERFGSRLRAQGYVVTEAAGGNEAMGILQREHVDLVLLDNAMPEMSGPDVLRAIKSDERFQDIPVIMISGVEEVGGVAASIGLGAADYVASPFDPVLLRARIEACLENKRLREQEIAFLRQIQREKAHSDQLVNVVIPLGVSLLEERDLNRLLERVLMEARKLAGADGGTLYLRTADDQLRFMMVRSDSLNIIMGGTSGVEVPFPALRLYDAQTGAPNHSHVACHAALTGETINIPDAYIADQFDFHGTKAFDQQTGYRSQSFLTVPLRNQHRKVIGVLQLINAMDPETKHVIAFDRALQQCVESLSQIAAAALENLIRQS